MAALRPRVKYEHASACIAVQHDVYAHGSFVEYPYRSVFLLAELYPKLIIAALLEFITFR